MQKSPLTQPQLNYKNASNISRKQRDYLVNLVDHS